MVYKSNRSIFVCLLGVQLFFFPLIYTLNNNLKYGTLNDKLNYGYIRMKKFSNHTLDVTPIRSFVVEKSAECGVSCIQEKTPKPCVSINVQKLIHSSQLDCSLLATDKYRSHANFTAKKDVDHYAVIVMISLN